MIEKEVKERALELETERFEEDMNYWFYHYSKASKMLKIEPSKKKFLNLVDSILKKEVA